MVPEPAEGFFRLFVYGTLKRGFANHERFCASAVQIRTAQIRGRLFETPWGHPVVALPAGEILARGSADHELDGSRQRALAMEPAPPKHLPGQEKSFGWVQGELLDFSNPHGWLVALDHFEEFDPVGGGSRFERVLVLAYLDESISIPAWVYAGAGILSGHAFPEITGGRWQ